MLALFRIVELSAGRVLIDEYVGLMTSYIRPLTSSPALTYLKLV